MGFLTWLALVVTRRAAAEDVAERVYRAERRNGWRRHGDGEGEIAETARTLGWEQH